MPVTRECWLMGLVHIPIADKVISGKNIDIKVWELESHIVTKRAMISENFIHVAEFSVDKRKKVEVMEKNTYRQVSSVDYWWFIFRYTIHF
ncbi:hypothetical protein HY310_01925 [Candidatus Microgenomates bacterium]|nr:hypothetical protein [Candidatus Microgenomates bacterium]